MTILPLRHSTQSDPALRTIDQRRAAGWLAAKYTDLVWTIADSQDHTRTAKIDFRYPLADGRLLNEAEQLYATVKEYAWWLRDGRYSRIDDAATHALQVRHIMHLAHALTLRNIWSFAHLQPFDVEQLVEECRYGVDAVIRASERVAAHLDGITIANTKEPRSFGGLPVYVDQLGNVSTYIHAEQLVADCNLPISMTKLPRVAVLIARAAREHGIMTPWGKKRYELPPLKNVSVPTLYRWLVPLEQLHAMRRRAEAATIPFRPFPGGAGRVAVVKGTGASRTPIPPPTLAIHLLEHAARWVIDTDPEIIVGNKDQILTLNTFTACWIVIASFTARRAGEIEELQNDCLVGDDGGGWWLDVYIEKTLQKKDLIPIPLLVARAVSTLRVISAGARQEMGTDQLFCWLQPSGRVSRFNIRKNLDDFAAKVNVPLHKPRNGPASAWHWHPHQFRRFFAVLYFYRFEGANIESLSHHLRHFSLEMTRRYVTQDKEVAALWTDVEWGYMGDVARSIVAGERSVSGAAGELLKKTARRLTDLFRKKLHIAPIDRVGASLSLIMQRKGLVLTPKPWVTCSCPRTHHAAAEAACQRSRPPGTDISAGPDFAYAGPSVCYSCPHAILESSREPFISAELTHTTLAAGSSLHEGTIFGELQKARVIELGRLSRTLHDKAGPLERPAGEEK